MKPIRMPLWIPAVLILAILALTFGPSLWNEIIRIISTDTTFGITPENFPRVDGSTSTRPITMLVACRAAKVQCDWKPDAAPLETFIGPVTGEEIPYTGQSGTHGAYENLILKQADVILVARPPSPDELAMASQNGITLEMRPIALDAFIFIANAQNPVTGFTPEQAKAIYTGGITNWMELGGNDAKIDAYQRDRNSGSQELMDALVLKGEPPIDAPLMVDNTMLVSFNNVGLNPNGLAYSVYYYEAKIAHRAEVKVMAINGIFPNPDTIRQRQYAYVTEVYAVIRADLDRASSAYHLYEWLQSDRGQKLIEESGYVGVR